MTTPAEAPTTEPTTTPFPILTSRSAYIDHCFCKRLRWYGWEIFKGWDVGGSSCPGGLAPEQKSMDLLLGEVVHMGMESLFKSHMKDPSLPPSIDGTEEWVDVAVDLAMARWWEVVNGGGVKPRKVTPEFHQWKIQEGAAMAEGMIRAAACKLMPNLMERYEVLEVEREEGMVLTKFNFPEDTAKVQGVAMHWNVTSAPTPLIFQGKLDALVRELETGDLHIISFKTSKEWGGMQEMQFKRDIQGLTEAAVVEERIARTRQKLRQLSPKVVMTLDWAKAQVVHADGNLGPIISLEDIAPAWMLKYPDLDRVTMVQMVILLKGREYESKTDPGLWRYDNPLTQAFKLHINGITPEFDESKWAWSYKTPKVRTRNDKYGNKGDQYIGYLGDEWARVGSWEHPDGVKGWVRDMANQKIQPEMGDGLAGCFVLPEPWARSDRDMKDIMTQIAHEEVKIAIASRDANRRLMEGDVMGYKARLNVDFPQTGAHAGCTKYGAMCGFEGVCWSGEVKGMEELLAPGSGLVLRVPHHEVELP